MLRREAAGLQQEVITDLDRRAPQRLAAVLVLLPTTTGGDEIDFCSLNVGLGSILS